MGWEPNTLEDHLLDRYHDEHPGMLFLEVPVGGGDEYHGPRRIDGVLICGLEPVVHPQHSYTNGELQRAAEGNEVHVLEAKRTLNRNVIGQVQVGTRLLEDVVSASELVPVAVCADNNTVLQSVCDDLGFEVAIYADEHALSNREVEPSPVDGRQDIRNPPDQARKEAFLRGWSAAVDGRLYRSVRERKTHQNMGNLFGWIYGDEPLDFREATWRRYVEHATGRIDSRS
jgi:hypothetical protein